MSHLKTGLNVHVHAIGIDPGQPPQSVHADMSFKGRLVVRPIALGYQWMRC